MFMVNWDNLWQKEENKRLAQGPSLRHKIRLVLQLIEKYSGGRKDVKILDVACGSGVFLSILAREYFKYNNYSSSGVEKIQLFGVDRSVIGLEMAKKKCIPCNFEILDIEKESLSGDFDIITCMNALEEMKNDETALANMGRMLKIGGHLILVTPHSMKYWTKKDEDALNFRRYEINELARKCKKAGLEKVEIFTWGWPLFSLYYKFMAKVNQEKVLQEGGPGFLIALIQKILYRLFFFDDRFVRFNRGRVLLGVFKKT